MVAVVPGSTIVVWFSCGAASAVAAKKTVEKYGRDCDVRIVNNPIEEEHEDNQRFLKDVESWVGVPVEYVTSSKYPNQSCKEVWDHRSFMSGPTGAPCTIELKKRARQEWERENHVDYSVLGFTADEAKRHDSFVKAEPLMTVIPVLLDEDIEKNDCFYILNDAGIDLPMMYKLGFPNANCIGCVKATSPTYWNHVRKHFPEIFTERAEQSRRIGAKLARHKGERVYLDELPSDAQGRPLKSIDFECGLFCASTANQDVSNEEDDSSSDAEEDTLGLGV